jgi:hypothetical protein
LAPIDYQRFNTWTTIQLAEAYDENSERINNNFKENISKFTEKIDYYSLQGIELKKYINKHPKLIPQNRLKVALWTISGILKHAEILNTLSSWRGFKYLVDINILSKDLSSFNSNIGLSASLKFFCTENKEPKGVANQAINLSLKALDRIFKLEEKLNNSNRKFDTMACDIAIQLGLYSKSNSPHDHLIGAIARTLNMPIRNKDKYEDEEIIIVPDHSNVDGYWQVYYKPTGIKKIADWFHINKDSIYFIEYYRKDTKDRKKGDIKGYGYKVLGKRYWLRVHNSM